MRISGSAALVTGANRGLGRAYARELLSRGAARVFGAARQPAQVTEPPKISPESVARQVFDAVEAGQLEVLADGRTRTVKASLPRGHELIYPPIQEFWDAAVGGTP
jgi:NAD(P)-dependent dehydrogenase (short-subunit alcohol dehydrogenase family)